MIKQAAFQIFLWTFNFKYIYKLSPRAKHFTKLLSFLQKLADFCLNNSRYAGWNFVPTGRLKPAKAMPIHADSYLYLSCQKQVLPSVISQDRPYYYCLLPDNKLKSSKLCVQTIRPKIEWKGWWWSFQCCPIYLVKKLCLYFWFLSDLLHHHFVRILLWKCTLLVALFKL